MSRKYKILFIIYLIVVGIVIFTSDNLSEYATKLEYVQCGSATGIPKPVPQLTTIAYTLLVAGTPIILIAFSIITLVKATVGGNADEIAKARNKLFKKFIISAIIFLSASIVQFVLLKVTSNNNDRESVTACLKCFLYYSSGRCTSSDTGNDVETGTYSRSHSNLAQPTTSNRKSNTTTSTNNSNTTVSGNNNSSNTTVSGNNSTSNTTRSTKTVLVGDSRTVGMCGYTTNNFYNGNTCRDYITVSQVSKGASWFKSTAESAVNKILTQDTNNKYNIVLLLGTNDAGSKAGAETASVNTYTSELKRLADGEWKNHNIIFVSVPPIGQTSLDITQAQINTFNSKMKNNIASMNKKNVSYCDITGGLNLSGKMGDGVHYSKEGYDLVYNQIKSKCL